MIPHLIGEVILHQSKHIHIRSRNARTRTYTRIHTNTHTQYSPHYGTKLLNYEISKTHLNMMGLLE